MRRALALSFCICLATAADVAGQHYPVRHFGTDVGLPKSMVAGIAQDEDGFLWLGTSGGVCRFDGIAFASLSTVPPMEYFYAKTFLRDSKGEFWLGMSENGLVHIRGEKASHLGPADGLPDNSVWALLEDATGNVWVGTGKGLAVLLSADRGKESSRFQPAFEPELAHLEVHRIVEDAQRRLWIGTTAGLFQSVGGRITRHWPGANQERCLARHPDGFILVATGEGLFRSEADSLVAFYLDPKLKEYNLTDLAVSESAVWMATYGQGLLRLEGGRLEVIGEKNGLLTNYLYSLFVDREGNIWIGSIHGLTQLFELAFVNYTKDDGLIANSVHSLAQDRMGNIYLGGDEGISIITRDTVLTLDHSSENIPLHRIIFMSSEEQAEGVSAWTDDGMKFHVFVRGGSPFAVLQSRAKGTTRGLRRELTDRFGNQWFSTPDSGIYCTTPRSARLHWTMREGLPTNTIFEACEDTSGAVWFSTIGDGLLRFRDGKFDHFTMADGLPSNHVEVMNVHPVTKDLWFTTNNGPARWRGDDARPRFETFPEIERLPARDLGGLKADREGNLWFNSSGGVVRFDGERFELFVHGCGLLGGAVIGLIVDSEGHIWVGGARGATEIIPERLRFRVEPAAVFPTRIEARGRALDEVSNVRLSHTENDLRFVYQGLCLRYPTGLTYSYRLEGLSPEWSPFTAQDEVRFPSLPAGSYRFSVRAMNVRGAISERPAEFAFTILPPVWQRWWFLLASSLTLFFAARAVYRWRIGHLLAVERMRARIAADLHDDIASSLASVALYSEVIQRQLHNASEEVCTLLGRIRDLSREAMDNIGIIVWAVDPRHDDLTDVLGYFRRHAGQICSAAGIAFLTHFPERPKPLALSPEQRRTVYLILKEGLANVLRHSRCSAVEFTCEFQDRTLDLRLEDNGRGFDSDTLKGGHGLSNMRMRAESIGAELDIIPRPGEGTVLRLRLKMT